MAKPSRERPSIDEVLAVLVEVEDLTRTLDRFPGLTHDDLRAILSPRSRPPRPDPKKAQLELEPRRELLREVHIWTDGASRGNPGRASIGVSIRRPDGRAICQVSEPIGIRTNNYAEYEAVRAGLAEVRRLGASRVVVHADSELVVRQLNGVYRVKNAALKPLFDAVKTLESTFSGGVVYRHVPREQNIEADRLANLALDLER